MFLGRVVRPGIDPVWLDTDRGYALAWTRHKAETCSCGTRPDEWSEDREAYVADTHYCRGCELLLSHRADGLPKDGEGKPIPGFHAFLQRREVHEALHPDDDN